MARAHLRVGKDGSIEFGGLAGLAFVEPKARGHLVRHYFLLDPGAQPDSMSKGAERCKKHPAMKTK
jgi:hypothetical protein